MGHPEEWTWVEDKAKFPEEDMVFKGELQRIRRLRPKKNKTFKFNDYGVDPYENITTLLK